MNSYKKLLINGEFFCYTEEELTKALLILVKRAQSFVVAPEGSDIYKFLTEDDEVTPEDLVDDIEE